MTLTKLVHIYIYFFNYQENGFKRIVDQFCKLGKDFTNLQSQHEQTLEDLRLKQLSNDDLPSHTFKQVSLYIIVFI